MGVKSSLLSLPKGLPVGGVDTLSRATQEMPVADGSPSPQPSPSGERDNYKTLMGAVVTLFAMTKTVYNDSITFTESANA